jgi:general secretion pathway protein I
MKFVQRPTDSAGARRRPTAAFTLAEVLAALLFMAVVIPVALEGMHVASRSGSIAVRKSQAERIAERVLNESIVTTNWSNGGSQSGDVTEGVSRFHWVLNNAAWNIDPNINTMRLLSVDVSFAVQGQNNSVRLSTLVDSAPPTNTASQ